MKNLNKSTHFPHTPIRVEERIMSVGTPTPPSGGTSTGKKKKKKKKAAGMFDITFSNACKWFTCLFFLGFFLKGCLFCGGSGAEPFNPQRMSQVPRIWPRSAWTAPQEEVQATQPNLLTRALRNAEVTLGNGLRSIPQYTEDMEWRPKSWHGPLPQRKDPPPFQFFDEWAADCQRQQQ